MVVLLEDPGLRLVVDRVGRRLCRRPRRLLDLVPRRLVGQEPRRDRPDELAVDERAQLAVVGDLADHGAGKLPARADRLHVGDPLRTDDGDHPLLRLRDHDLPRLQVGLAKRHPVEVHVDAGAAAGHLGERRREPGRAAVLQPDDQLALDEVERDLDQRLAAERIADLYRRPFVVRALEVLAREHRGAADAVAPGEGAVEDERVPGPGRLRA